MDRSRKGVVHNEAAIISDWGMLACSVTDTTHLYTLVSLVMLDVV
jgi:hypothetical protein